MLWPCRRQAREVSFHHGMTPTEQCAPSFLTWEKVTRFLYVSWMAILNSAGSARTSCALPLSPTHKMVATLPDPSSANTLMFRRWRPEMVIGNNRHNLDGHALTPSVHPDEGPGVLGDARVQPAAQALVR